MKVTVTTVSVGANDVLLDCTECGPMGILAPDDVMNTVYDHLNETHDCDMETIHIAPIPEEQ